MRALALSLVCLLALLGTAAAEEKKKEEPNKPAKEMTEAERQAGVKKADELNARVEALYGQGKVKEATPVAREVLAIRERILGPEHADVALSLNNLGLLLDEQGASDQARPLYERALKIYEKTLGPDHPQVSAALGNLGHLLEGKGDYDEARPLYERALKIREKHFGPEHPEVVHALDSLAWLLMEQAAFDAALPLYERSLKICEKALGPDHPRVAKAVNFLALVQSRRGALDKARPLFERALKIREKALGPNSPDVAQSLNNLASLHQDQGDFEEARLLFARSLQICEKVLGPEHPYVANCLNNLAGVLQNQGAVDEARPHIERALRIREKVLGPDHPRVAQSLNSMAMLLRDLGAYDEARPLLERAQAIREKTYGPEHPVVAQSLNNMALLLQGQGAYQESRPLFERALKIWEKTLGAEHPQVALGLSNLAANLRDLREFDDARPLFERAVAISEKVHGPEHPDVAMRLNNLATVLKDLKAFADARPLFERALKIQEKLLGPGHSLVALTLNNLAVLMEDLGSPDAAIPHYERALEIREEAHGPDHLDVAHSLYNLGLLLRDREEYGRAGPMLERALAIVERHARRNLTGLTAPQRIALGQSVRHYLDGWLTLAPHLKRSGHEAVLRSKGSLARMAAAERRLARNGSAEVLASVAELRVAERRLARLANAGLKTTRSGRRRTRSELKKARVVWRREYAQAAAEHEALVLTLRRKHAPLRAGMERLDIALSDIQGRLANDAALLDLLRAGNRYLAWIVRPKGKPERIDLGEAAKIEAAALAFSEAVADANIREWQTAGAALRALVSTPIIKHLGPAVKTLYVCPDAALAATPFAALPGLGSGRLLKDEYAISVLSMAQDLVPWNGAAKPGRGALLLGGVDYGEASVGAQETRIAGAGVNRAPRGGSFLYLPGTKAETRAVQNYLSGDGSILLAKEATENRLRASVKGKRVLHLATHGFVRDDLMRGLTRRGKEREWLGADMERQLARGYDPMLMGGLALAGANPRQGGHGDDGILTALEASHLDLDGVELVVLSACQTALGTAASGEGVIGLMRGFQMAGAKRVIGSLWRVDDFATKALMVKFYELWSPKTGMGIGAAEALKKAQEHVRNHLDKDGKRHWAHPYYWAAWVLWGPRD